MRFHLLGFLSVHALLNAQAFTPSGNRRLTQRSVVDRYPLPIRHSSTAVSENKKSWNDLHHFNIELDKLAEYSGNFNQPVISKAAECEELWASQLGDDSDGSVKPDTVSFNTVLKAWNRCCNVLSEASRTKKSLTDDFSHNSDVYTVRDAAKRATTLLLQQEKEGKCPLDTQSFNIVIDAWAKSRVEEAPEAAERLLKLMLDTEDMEPDTLSYHGVLDAWANSGREESLSKVTQIFSHMEGLQESGKDVRASIRTVNAILNAHAKAVGRYNSYQMKQYDKAAKCADAAFAFFEKAKRKSEETQDSDWKFDVTTYTSMVDCFARLGSYQASQKAESLLQELKKMYQETNDIRLRPNFRTYTAVISAWARTRSAESPGKVMALLSEMKENSATAPNSRAYTSAIQCWGRSRDSTKAQQVLKILRTMKDEDNDDCRPTILSYNSAIDACARCQGTVEQQTAAFKIAFAILKASEGDKSAKPNQATYGILLKAVSFLLPPGKERNQIASAVFDKARKAGLVEFATITNLRKCVDAEVMIQLMDGLCDQNGTFTYESLPPAWSKNVR